MNNFVLILKSLSATLRVACVGYLLVFFSSGPTLVHLASEGITGHHCCEMARCNVALAGACSTENWRDSDVGEVFVRCCDGCLDGHGVAIDFRNGTKAPSGRVVSQEKDLEDGGFRSNLAWHSQDVCLICNLFSLPIAISARVLTPMAQSIELLDMRVDDEFHSVLILAYIARGPPAI
jgi:hypothetical protein